MNESLKAEIVRAIQNGTAAIALIMQLRDGGSDEEAAAMAAQLADLNAQIEAVLAGSAPPSNGPPEAT